MSKPRQSLGRWGEQEAARYLETRGYSLLAVNVRTPYGEIDLIARQPAGEPTGQASLPGTGMGSTIVFVEVKARSSRTFGDPEVSVNPRKQAHLLNAAQYYIQQHPEEDCAWRIDVIAIRRCGASLPPEIVHFVNALGI
jgi:putative endonuclease